MKNKKAILVGLGCPKNDVDTGILYGILVENGYTLVEDTNEADLAIVNTCGFIEEAKVESIDTIMNLVNLKKENKIKQIAVFGCLTQRYRESVRSEIPEVDYIFGVEEFADFSKKIDGTAEIKSKPWEYRYDSPSSHYAYLKIAEGCNNRCHYCAVPLIRGNYRSRAVSSLIEEAEMLKNKGVKELILVAQDTTMYGRDLHDGSSLYSLVKRINDSAEFDWIRIMYAYPAHLSDDFIKIYDFPNVCRYVDLPVQHISDNVLSSMGRKDTKKSLYDQINRLRSSIPGIAIRTSLIVGYPTEKERDFEELFEFVNEIKFERLGVFSYSAEDGTAAFSLGDPVDAKIKNNRAEILIDCQKEIAYNKNTSLIGKNVKVLIDEYDKEINKYIGRTEWDAPEIDNIVIVSSKSTPGQFRDIYINNADSYEIYEK